MYLPIWTQGVLGKNATEAGMILMPIPVFWTVGAMMSGNLVGRLQTKQIILLGGSILSASTLLLFMLSTHSHPSLIYIAMGMFGLGMGLITPIFMVTIQASVPANKRGTAVGLNTFINTFSQTLGAAAFGTIFNTVIHSAGEGNVNLVTSEHGSTATGSQEVLASSVHIIFSGTFILAVISLVIAWVCLQSKQQETVAPHQKGTAL